MSGFWSWFVTIVTLLNIGACLWLIRWTSRTQPGEVPIGEPTGHTWDNGELSEYNNPMPRWWLIMFYAMIVFGLIYLVLYPGLGNYKGLLGWTEEGQYQQEMAAAHKRYGPIFAAYAKQDIVALSQDPKALGIGRRLFVNNCAQCHGSDAKGAPGFPNLADKDWLYGGEPTTIQQTILHGRNGVMPAWGKVLGKSGVENVVAYVMSLSGMVSKEAGAAGEATFKQICSACHGPDGKGNHALGAPNLTDRTWLYGGSRGILTQTVSYGRQGHMPAWQDFLGADKVHLAAAYVYSLSHGQQ